MGTGMQRIQLKTIALCAVALLQVCAIEPPTGTSDRLGPIRSRLTIKEIALATAVAESRHGDSPATMFEAERLRLVLLSPEEDGESKVAWQDAKDVIHITALDANDKRKGKDILLNGRLCDFVAHNNQAAVLLLRGGVMRLVIVDEHSKIELDQPLCFNRSTELHMGSLAWNGEKYACYFGIHHGGHEGDTLRIVDPKGSVASVWDWGCSHCIDMRVVFNGLKPVTLGLSDAYPTTGLCINHNARILAQIPGDASGGTQGRIGGMMIANGDACVAYSHYSGGSWRIVFSKFNATAPFEIKTKRYITEAGDFRNLKLAKFGQSEVLVAYQRPDTRRLTFQRLDFEGVRQGKPEQLDVWSSPRGDFKSFPSGDIGWAYTVSDKKGTRLQVARIRSRN